MHENVFNSIAKEEKKNQPKVNTVQFWSQNYSCSSFPYDDYFTLWEPRISLESKNQILVNTVQKKYPKTPPCNRSHLCLLPKLSR